MTGGLSVDVDHAQGAFRLQAAFEAPPGVTALFGRSGSGKTTLVNIISGLVRPDRGRVEVNGTVLLDTTRRIAVPRHRRRIGYVFQEARLLPHLSVRQNLLFGRWFAPRREAGPDLEAVVDLLGLSRLLGRRPAGLSGGERQRVAVGRALLAKPRLLLMDEPLASLDETRKAEILPFIERLRDGAGVPIVYVSHALPEVIRLSDTLVLLEDGRVTAAGPTAAVLSRLDAGGLAAGQEAGALLDATVLAHDLGYGLTTLSTAAGTLHVPIVDGEPGSRRRIQVLARDVMLSMTPPDAISALNVLPAVVAEVGNTVHGDPTTLVRLDCDGVALLSRVTRKSADTLALSAGKPVYAIIKSVALDPGGAPVESTG